MTESLVTPRHEAFAQGLARGLTADAAYAAAGYRPNRGNAVRLKANERVRQRVAELVEEGAERAKVDIARVLAELCRIAFGGMGDFLTIGPCGEPIIDLTRCSPEVLNTLVVLEAEIIENGAVGAPSIRRISIRRLDKLRALAALARHLGLGKPAQSARVDRIEQALSEIRRRGPSPNEPQGPAERER